MKNMKKYLNWGFALVFFMIFILLLFVVISKGEAFFDMPIMQLAYSLRNKGLSLLFKIITFLGDSKFIILLTLLLGGYLLFYKKDKYTGILVFVNTINTAILNQGIKYIVRRPRPINLIIDEDGFSFPSGHAMMSVCFYALIIYLVWKSKLNKDLKIIITCGLVLLLYIIGFTRIYFGAHYPSDLVAGYMITLTYMLIFIPMYNDIMKK